MSGLNPAQKQAVNTLSGPMLVLAGAGSGKTRVVTLRIAKLISKGTLPERILAVTFTNKAANEMQHRVREVLGRQPKNPPVIATFHSYCLQVLRRQIHHLGYPPRFTIFDYGDQIGVARSVLREIKMNDLELRANEFLNIVSDWKTRGIRSDKAAHYAETDRQHLAAVAFRRYQRTLKNMGAVDFDDILLCTDDLFTNHPEVREEEAGLFDHLLIDEYQDTNETQYRLVKALATKHRNLCVVGDDDQAIYGWRGAEVAHILRFGKDWPDATIIKLEDNYRSTEAIIEIANRVISYNQVRHDKVLKAARRGGEKPKILQFKDAEEEAREVVRDISTRLRRPELEPRDFALLFRTNEQPRAFETELRKAKVPYVLIGGKSFFDQTEVRAILSYLRAITAPRDDVAMLRIINTPPRGIGMVTIESVRKHAISKKTSVWETITKDQGALSLAKGPAAALRSFVVMMHEMRQHAKQMLPRALTRKLLDKIPFEAELEKQFSNPLEREARWRIVEEMLQTMSEYERSSKKPSLRQFVDDMTLNVQDFDSGKETELQKNAVALMTLHSAKGLEFSEVYMVGLEEGILPHHRSADGEYSDDVEEERRLCYVGITRAQDRLTLTLPLSRVKWGKPRDTIPSRFLFEVIGKAEKAHHAPPPPAAKRGTTKKKAQPAAKKPTKKASTKRKASRKPSGGSATLSSSTKKPATKKRTIKKKATTKRPTRKR